MDPPPIVIPTDPTNPSITNFSPTFNTNVPAPFAVIISDNIPVPFTINYSWSIPVSSFPDLLRLTSNQQSPAITINTLINGENVPSFLPVDSIESVGNNITGGTPIIISSSYRSDLQITSIESLFRISSYTGVVAPIPVQFSYYIS